MLGPVGLDVPVGEDEQGLVDWVPGLTVDTGQGVSQRITYLQAGELTQKMLQGQVLVGEPMQHFQPLPLIVVQVPRASEAQNGQVQQMIQFVPQGLRFAMDHPQRRLRVGLPIVLSGHLQASLHLVYYPHLLLRPL